MTHSLCAVQSISPPGRSGQPWDTLKRSSFGGLVTYDVVIVGGGIVGTACALAFSRAGMRVALVEPAEIGGGATVAAMGHVVVLDDSPAQLALTRYSQMLWRQMANDLPPDAEYAPRGTLWVASDDEDLQAIRRKYGVYCEHGIPCEVLDAGALAHAEPALRPRLAGALRVCEDVVVSPQAAARFLLQQALAGTATLFFSARQSHGRRHRAAEQWRGAAGTRAHQRGGRVGFGVDPRTSRC